MRILFIDAYDSFSNNIISLLQEELEAQVESIKINDSRFVLNDDAFYNFLASFDAVVAGPGPGHPENKDDIGLIARLWTLPDDHILPVLGICLGFQSLALSLGASIGRLTDPRHGIVTPISHNDRGIFRGLKDLSATQYHSLHAQIQQNDLWQPLRDLLPLAWDLSDVDNGPILMAIQHLRKPFVGMQFHPESICTSSEAKDLIQQWWHDAARFDRRRRPQVNPKAETKPVVETNGIGRSYNCVQYSKIALPAGFDILDLTSQLRSDCAPFEPIVLQSGLIDGQPVHPTTGRYSILGFHDAASTHFRYSCALHELQISKGQAIETKDDMDIAAVFNVLKSYVHDHKAVAGPDTPFWGGLVGFVAYEAGLESINVSPGPNIDGSSDVWFVMVERSVIVDHIQKCAYVQSIRPDDNAWMDSMLARALHITVQINGHTQHHKTQVLHNPDAVSYCDKVRNCQSHLRAGSSYELCLTEQTLLRTQEQPWTLYEQLSKLNAAPFAAYLSLKSQQVDCGISIISSSPERFLSWTRQGKCQFRPIKGTVQKRNGTTKAHAETILRSKKEQAENLMIVDLIRHDLTGVNGISNVRVPSLMSIEEYATVFQLVSVIEGDMASSDCGIDILAASLPPGSMTGAPKRRSCELLKTIEKEPRSIYSGVIGYLDVGGGGDFSVVIRTAFKWDSESIWRIGAGGAVTVLSTAEGEYEEMLAKRERLMKVFS